MNHKLYEKIDIDQSETENFAKLMILIDGQMLSVTDGQCDRIPHRHRVLEMVISRLSPCVCSLCWGMLIYLYVYIFYIFYIFYSLDPVIFRLKGICNKIINII